MEEETTEVTIVAQDSLSLITKAEIDVQISTAKAFPRSIKMFLDKAMSIATISEEVAASCNYAVPRGGKAITGPSIRLAEIVCSAYGNIRSGARVIANDGKTITAQGICHDLETNNCVTVEVKRKITDKNGRTFSEDMQVVTGNAACAIALRNAVFKVIPAALINDIYEQTKEVAKGKAETLPARRKKAVDFFIQNGVNEKQICEVLDVKKIDDIDLDKLSILRAMVSTVKNGEGTVKEMFEKEIESLKSKVLNDEQ
ncbi:MAG: hypothetical protein FGM16_06720 [Flavobacterium sp.]|nr:hypothetical protein [Flavobacterium sp.]